jgi:hypothetical protein
VIDRADSARSQKGDHQMFSLTSPNVTRVQLPDSSPRLSRRTMPLVKVAGAAAIALFAAGNTLANAAENPARMAHEEHACAVVMGLHRPGDLYDTCIRSLNKTLSELDQASLVSRNQSGCAQKGLMPGTSAFAVCVVDAEQSPADAGSYQAIVTGR